MEIDFLKRALQRVDEQRRLQVASSGARSSSRFRKK
jgi:hypothetical protein